MKPIEIIGHIDEQGQLHVELPEALRPGPVKVTLQEVTPTDEVDDWRGLINHAWAADWSDPREDIYTLEDGEPEHGPR
jgi:hypothetical protein